MTTSAPFRVIVLVVFVYMIGQTQGCAAKSTRHPNNPVLFRGQTVEVTQREMMQNNYRCAGGTLRCRLWGTVYTCTCR